MAGHNKWSQIKHKKAKTDAQKGKVFSKMARELTTAARTGGGDPDLNARLRLAIQKAKDANMPNDNITRAIEKGVGGGDGQQMEEILYEAYGPDGVAFLIDVLTDNKNRTVANLRALLTRANGSLANKGAVSYQFDKKGMIVCSNGSNPDQVMELALDAGADDVVVEPDNSISVLTAPSSYESVRSMIESASIEIVFAEITMIPQSTVDLDELSSPKVLKLQSALEQEDDVQNVYSNYSISDDILSKIDEGQS